VKQNLVNGLLSENVSSNLVSNFNHQIFAKLASSRQLTKIWVLSCPPLSVGYCQFKAYSV
jgi:hypothetical protein